MLNEVDIDFRMPGLPHSVVKQAESSRVRELVKKIENHPDRHALQLDLQQDKAHNPFSATAKRMIQDVSNVELFGMSETEPKTQCKACLSYWSEGIVYCTCGHLLKETVATRSFIVFTLDVLSIPEYVIKKGRHHGHRYAKAPENKEYYLAHNLKKRCIKRDFTGIHDRFLRDHVFRERMLENNRDEDVCRKWDDLAEEDHTYRMSESEYFYYRQNWWISLNKSGNTGEPMRKRYERKPSVVYIEPVYTEKLEDDNSDPRPCGRTNNGSRRRVLPPPCGNGANPGGLLKNSKKVNKRGLRSNGATCCLQIFGENLRRMAFTSLFYFVTDRSFTAERGLL